MKVKPSNKFYKKCYRIAGPVIRFFRPFEVVGAENIKSSAAMVCSNHSAMIDPFLIALAFDINTHVHVLSKIELFKIPVISALLRKLGMIPVDRGVLDVASIKSSLTYLKKGEKVVIFPEGTRTAEHNATQAKNGAVKLAERAGVPLVPVFIPRKKPFFRRSKIVFGKPYLIHRQKERRSIDDYSKLSEELMNTIQALEPLSK